LFAKIKKKKFQKKKKKALTSIRVPELLPGEKNVHDPTSGVNYLST